MNIETQKVNLEAILQKIANSNQNDRGGKMEQYPIARLVIMTGLIENLDLVGVDVHYHKQPKTQAKIFANANGWEAKSHENEQDPDGVIKLLDGVYAIRKIKNNQN